MTEELTPTVPPQDGMTAGHVARYCSRCGRQMGGSGTNIFCTCTSEDFRAAYQTVQRENARLEYEVNLGNTKLAEVCGLVSEKHAALATLRERVGELEAARRLETGENPPSPLHGLRCGTLFGLPCDCAAARPQETGESRG